jgi:hypothetical protein
VSVAVFTVYCETRANFTENWGIGQYTCNHGCVSLSAFIIAVQSSGFVCLSLCQCKFLFRVFPDRTCMLNAQCIHPKACEQNARFVHRDFLFFVSHCASEIKGPRVPYFSRFSQDSSTNSYLYLALCQVL